MSKSPSAIFTKITTLEACQDIGRFLVGTPKVEDEGRVATVTSLQINCKINSFHSFLVQMPRN